LAEFLAVWVWPLTGCAEFATALAVASGPADACAFKWFGLIETATRIPQRVAITVFLVFKFASTSALRSAAGFKMFDTRRTDPNL